MLLKQFYLGCLAHASYLIVDEATGTAVVVDPQRDLETPGHTPEAISILVYDLQQDPTQPHAVLTGDTLFIGDVGRPDLMASDKYIDGSLHLPLAQLQRQLSLVPRDRTVVLQCAGGYRSAIAASLLANHGMTAMADLVGGLAAWEAAGLDLVTTTVS